MRIILANPRGFCAGVERAIAIVERALELYGAPVYVRHAIVHNKHVVDGLRGRGAVFVEDLSEVPEDSIVIFSAHGVAQAVREDATRRKIKVFDATCPLVTKVHMEVGHYQNQGREMHSYRRGRSRRSRRDTGPIPAFGWCRGHVFGGVRGVWELEVKNPEYLAYVTQTTLSVDETAEIINALHKRFTKIIGPKKEDICYAAQNRQNAVKRLVDDCDLILVVGSHHSHNWPGQLYRHAERHRQG